MKTAKDILAELSLQNLYGNLRMRLESYASFLLRDGEAARDVVSNAVISVLQSKEEMKTGSLEPYLFKVVHNQCLNYRRDQARHQAIWRMIREREDKAFTYYSSLLESNDPSHLFTSEISSIYLKQLSSLPKQTRQTFLLRQQGRSYKEIARILGITENRVDKNLRKALSVLKKALTEYL